MNIAGLQPGAIPAFREQCPSEIYTAMLAWILFRDADDTVGDAPETITCYNSRMAGGHETAAACRS